MDASDCSGCRERDKRIAQLETRAAKSEALAKELMKRVKELEAKLGRNSSNSSVPPSANPLAAPKPPAKEPSGRKAGGQPGHAPHTRDRLPPELVTHTKNFIPKTCEKCQHPLP